MIPTSRSHLRVASRTHAGLSGKQNEDRYAVGFYRRLAGEPVLFAVVCDGIGGHRAGDVAADLAVRCIVQGVAEASGADPIECMRGAIQAASQVIASTSAGKADWAGMGATCACVWVDRDRLFTAHVGDSRIYLVRESRIQRVTVDHTWVQDAIEKGIIAPEEAHTHPNAHVLRRHLGAVALPEVDFRLRLAPDEDDQRALQNQGAQLVPGDILLLCTDGLTDLVWDDEILRVITTRNALKSAAEDLVARANERGGYDNVTVILIGVPRQAMAGRPMRQRWLSGLLRM